MRYLVHSRQLVFRKRLRRCRHSCAADQSAVTHFNVYLPLTHQTDLDQLLRDQTDSSSARYHQWLTPAQFKTQFGPSRADVAKVTKALEAAGFTVTGEQTQNLQVEGPVSAVDKLFATQLQQVRTPRGHVRLAAANHHLTLPDQLASVGAVVPEFTAHLESHLHSARPLKPLASASPLFRLSSNDSFFYANDLNEAYQLPAFNAEVTPLFSRIEIAVAGVGAHIGIVISSKIDPPISRLPSTPR